MTINEKIAEKMGWMVTDYIDGGYDISDLGKNDCAGLWLSKKLQARMVEDGWFVGVEQCAPHKERHHEFRAIAGKLESPEDPAPIVKHDAYADTEPAAIVALFCKVMDLKEE